MSDTRGGWELPISEHELTRLTEDLDEAHRTYLPAMHASAAELTEQIRDQQTARARKGSGLAGQASRRGFLLGAGGVAAAFALAACSSSGNAPSAAGASGAAGGAGSASPSSMYTGDLQVVALATALENQAVGAYTAALAAAKAGKLGTVPAAVGTFAQTAMSQHSDHAKAWNAVLTGAGKPAITDVPLSNQPATLQALGAVTDVGGVAKLALMLEQQAAETYLFATYNVTSPGGIATAATIAPVEAMHAAILNYVLGQYPVPDDFLGVDKAASPSLLTV
ncbi:ferritin-like domain-containing protein [Streptacidiphilus jiangxiensis]|uniref:Ferritin-like domain-containing protein n=1 Tax=Streptacidiphilus jiangxiensis TaxID=235985 RepID=A0A1H7NRD3_STRJI|nr:ferritin-like domain-containing protein [Streptacidiphilus jiangxiensis]SEL26083.1 Ferritin-like domain-containing protein [Streptacidiphilus jiangxiensis]